MIEQRGERTISEAVKNFIGTLATFVSHSKGDHGLRIDGRLKGDLKIAGDLVVGEKAQIMANVTARNVSVAGVVRGNISANRVEVLSTGEVWGSVSTNFFALDEGGFIQGQIDQRRFGRASLPFQTPGDVLAALEALETGWSRDYDVTASAPVSRVVEAAV